MWCLIARNIAYVGNIILVGYSHKNIKNISIFDNQEIVTKFLSDIKMIHTTQVLSVDLRFLNSYPCCSFFSPRISWVIVWFRPRTPPDLIKAVNISFSLVSSR